MSLTCIIYVGSSSRWQAQTDSFLYLLQQLSQCALEILKNDLLDERRKKGSDWIWGYLLLVVEWF